MTTRLSVDTVTKPTETIPIQPVPDRTLVSWIPINGVVVTAITRIWPKGACEACRLCPKCMADQERDVCQIQVAREVPQESAASFSTHGCTLIGAGGN